MDSEAHADVRGPLSGLLFVAGEPSGDRLAAEVLRAYGGPSFGIGGAASRSAGGETAVDLAEITGAGLSDAILRFPRVVTAFATLRRLVRRRAPRAALLVDYVEANALFGRWLRARGVPVVWCVAPQTWAWRPWRVRRLARSMDRLATLFPFEVAPWRAAGVDARWVGHPATETRWTAKAAARAALGLVDDGRAIAILPGSRPRELSRNLGVMLAAADRLGLPSRVLLAASLGATEIARIAGVAGHARVVAVPTSVGLGPVLRAFDVALCAAGTASLECALADVPPIVVARIDRLAAAILGPFLTTPHLALPNILLARRAYPELWQDAATPEAIAEQARVMLASPPRERAALVGAIDPGDGRTFGARVAGMLSPWL